jgi:hypothetical protein
MLTRREVLTGTAAASIGAIASAHGVAAAAPDLQGGLCGAGNLTNGVIARFDKPQGTIGVFLKFQDSAAELFYKPQVGDGAIELFWKVFNKGWSKVESKLLGSATGFSTDAFFSKVELDAASFFFKSQNDVAVTTDIKFGDNGGLDIFLKEETPNEG